jgi:hypothetical protein
MEGYHHFQPGRGHTIYRGHTIWRAARELKLRAMQTWRGENLKFILPCRVASDLHVAAASDVGGVFNMENFQ